MVWRNRHEDGLQLHPLQTYAPRGEKTKNFHLLPYRDTRMRILSRS